MDVAVNSADGSADFLMMLSQAVMQMLMQLADTVDADAADAA